MCTVFGLIFYILKVWADLYEQCIRQTQDTQDKIIETERRENPQAEKTADKKPARGQQRNFVLFSY